jgi:DNA-binding transcriptional MocR family regulator
LFPKSRCGSSWKKEHSIRISSGCAREIAAGAKSRSESFARAFPKGSTVTRPRGGYMLWVELPRPIDLAKARAAALAQHVAFAAGSVFFTNEPEMGCPSNQLRKSRRG